MISTRGNFAARANKASEAIPNPGAMTIWMAGAGIKPGLIYGATDEFGYSVADKPVHVHDLQATILQQLGLDHTRLTFRFQGRDYRLTDVFGEMVKEVLA